jgi:hypothetical protein
MIGGPLIGHNDPDYQERVVKFNELIANCAIYSTALDITDGTVSPLITRTIPRFGDWHLDLTPPKDVIATRLDLAPGALFPTVPV